MRYRNIRRGICKEFDKAFYRSRGGQFVWLVSIVCITVVIGIAIGRQTGVNDLRIIELILDPGAFADAQEKGSVTVQLIMTLVGAVVFTSLLINAFGNWLDRRIECYKKGEVFYDFDNHILILGANSMLLNIVKALVNADDNKRRDIVILTNKDAEELRSLIYSEIPKDKAEDIYVTYGNRTRKEMLSRLDAHETKSIYILGEDDEPTHDAQNLECYELLKDICDKSKNTIKCYMVLERASTLQHYYLKQGNDSTDKLHLTIINSLENIAQRLIVSREYTDNKLYPALDRNGIGEDSTHNVHLIIADMSQMAYYIATTAAHVCHFPNFHSKGLRTKISFIQDNIEQDMNYFVSRYQSLMDLSYRHFICPENPSLNKEFFPNKNYLTEHDDKKGFLDIEWEFIEGGIESEGVRKYLEHITAEDKDEYVTIAFCNNRPDVNVAAAQNLPLSIFYRDIPIFVYQPGGGYVISSASNTNLYRNMYPFGVKTDCYDSQYQKRIIYARRIKYIYNLQNNGEDFVSMPSDEELIKNWFNKDYSYALQQSNLYSANSIAFKLRSISYNKDRKLTDHEIEILSITEHNRWNIERLLLGFSAYPYKERMEIMQRINGQDEKDKEECNKFVKTNKNIWFLHKDIAPYEELSEKSKDYDRVIVRNITSVLD